MARGGEAGHRGLEQGFRGRRFQERDGGPRLSRRSVVRPRRHPLQLHPLRRYRRGQRHGPELHRPPHGRDSGGRRHLVPQCHFAGAQLAFRPDGSRRSARAQAGLRRRRDARVAALRGRSRGGPHAGTDAQHGCELLLPGGFAAQSVVHAEIRYDSFDHGLRAQQLYRPARRFRARRADGAAPGRRLRHPRHQLGIPHFREDARRRRGAAAAQRAAGCQARRPHVRVRRTADFPDARSHRPVGGPGQRPYQGGQLRYRELQVHDRQPLRLVRRGEPRL